MFLCTLVHQQLLRLEEARLGGHWIESKIIHEDLLQKALLRMAYEESHEHLVSTISIVRKEATTEREITELAARRESFDLFPKLADLSRNFDGAVRRGDAKEAEKIGESIKHFLSEVAKPPGLDDELIAMSVDIVESGVKISQFPERTDAWGSESEARVHWENSVTRALSVPHEERKEVYSSRLAFSAARAKAVIAQQGHKWSEAKVHLDKMLQLHDLGFLNDLISHDELVSWARRNESLIELWQLKDTVNKARQAHDYDRAYSLIGRCSKIDLGDSAEQDKATLVKEMYREVEKSDVIHLFDEIQASI